MSQQTIGTGAVANDGTGDPLRTAFGKVNGNFAELYAGAAGLLAKSAVAAPLTGVTAETVLATIPVPAGLIGVNGQIKVTAFWSMTASANAKTPRVRLGGLAGSVMFSIPVSTFAVMKSETVIANRNSAASQYLISTSARGTDGLVITAAGTPTTVNTAVAQDLVFTGQLALGTETLTLEGYTIEYMA